MLGVALAGTRIIAAMEPAVGVGLRDDAEAGRAGRSAAAGLSTGEVLTS